MEDRIAGRAGDRPGTALLALVAILAITAAWWALALAPVGTFEPDWLARTRAACFGAARGGLPDAGGWILLVGEPLGLLAVLAAGWRRSLASQFRWIVAHRVSFVTALFVAVLALGGVTVAAVRVAHAAGLGERVPSAPQGRPLRLDRNPPGFALVDQHGERISLSRFQGTPVLLTFAFGHCQTVCPAIVHDLDVARRTAGVDLPMVVVTLDPWRDSPDRLKAIADGWRLGPRDHVLSGSVDEVERLLDAFGVLRRRDTRTGEVEHVATTMLIGASGRIAWRVDGGWGAVPPLLMDIAARR